MWNRFESGVREAMDNENVIVNIVNTTGMETLADQKNMIDKEIRNGADGLIVEFIASNDTEKVVENVKRGLPGNIAERIFIYGGMIVDSLGEVHESYQTATIAFQNEMGEVESSVIWYRASEGQMPVFPSSEMAARLTRDSEEMENLNRTLTGITKVYEMQLKSASQQIGTIDQINEQTRKMAQQIEQLNSIYARMIAAMTANLKEK